ncbi:putative ribosomal protein L17 [Rosa chinensis]|uniref:Putative ribosomal protein L17 n=1 Tax=Rosa chinensis TaxID=74649 RepID=A0A2P6QXS0_ROSCH|nr:putative ribosomal protein L17 [Rosa chinensis]
MSIALDRNGNSGNGMIPRSGRFIHGMPCISIYVTKGFDQDRRLELEENSSSSRSSSVGNNSDESNGSSEGEVQSSFKGPLDTMDQLEEVLPVNMTKLRKLNRTMAHRLSMLTTQVSQLVKIEHIETTVAKIDQFAPSKQDKSKRSEI